MVTSHLGAHAVCKKMTVTTDAEPAMQCQRNTSNISVHQICACSLVPHAWCIAACIEQQQLSLLLQSPHSTRWSPPQAAALNTGVAGRHAALIHSRATDFCDALASWFPKQAMFGFTHVEVKKGECSIQCATSTCHPCLRLHLTSSQQRFERINGRCSHQPGVARRT